MSCCTSTSDEGLPDLVSSAPPASTVNHLSAYGSQATRVGLIDVAR
jgi:hypothetical protein